MNKHDEPQSTAQEGSPSCQAQQGLASLDWSENSQSPSRLTPPTSSRNAAVQTALPRFALGYASYSQY